MRSAEKSNLRFGHKIVADWTRALGRFRRIAGRDLRNGLWLLLGLFLPAARLIVAGAEVPTPVHSIDGSFVRDWLVLGPFPSREVEADLLAGAGGEANVRPKEGDTITTKNGKTLVWTRLRSKQDTIDFSDIYGPQEWIIAYAYCELNAGADTDTDTWATTSGRALLWINGENAREIPENAGGKDELPPTLPIRLKQGRNRCLLKLRLDSLRPFAFTFQPLPPERVKTEFHVTDGEGRPVSQAIIQMYHQSNLVARIQSDAAGQASACFYPLTGPFDVRVTSGGMGTWLYSDAMRQGERRKWELVLTNAVSIFGKTLTMNGLPQSVIVVQALSAAESSGPGSPELTTGPPVAQAQPVLEPRLNRSDYTRTQNLLPMPAFSETVLSDTNGIFRFVNLKPGRYHLRAHGPTGYVYPEGKNGAEASKAVTVAPGRTNDEVKFSFSDAKKGVWSRFLIKNGLVDSSPRSIHRTPDGMLWVGTDNRTLHAYDGVEFEVFSPPEIQGTYIQAINHDVHGAVWIGTDAGISRLEDRRIYTPPFNNELPFKSVASIATAADGTVWFGTLSGLCKFEGGQFLKWTFKNGGPSNEIGALMRDREGGLWMSTSRSLARFDGRNIQEPVRLNGVRSPFWERLHQSRDGAIWFCSPENGAAAFRYDGRTLSRLGDADGLLSRTIFTIAETSDGMLWFGTDRGLSRFDGHTFINYTVADGLSEGAVRDISVNPDDVLWCACSSGVSRFDPKGFTGIAAADGLSKSSTSTPAVFAIEPDLAGGYLVGTEWGGVYNIGDPSRRLSTNTSFLAGEYVRQIQRDSNGALWFGTAKGIFKQTDGILTKVLERNWIIALNSENPEQLWFGQGWFGGGVTRFNPKTGEEKVFTRAQGLPDDMVWAIERGLNGEVWIGTRDGLARFQDGRIENVGEKLGFPPLRVMSLRRDPDGTLWIGAENGMYRLRGTNLVSITAAIGAPRAGVWCSAQTPDGIFWMGTDRNGLLGSDGKAVTIIDKRDGLLGNEVFALRPDVDGSLLVGFADGGLTRYRRTKTCPSVRLIQVKFEDKSFSAFSNLPATETGKRVTVQYQEIDLKTHSEKRQFRYRVEGPSGKEIFAGVTRDRRFDWTPPKGGTYAFEVQAIDRDLNYSNPARLTFRAVVPWYSNTWIIVPGGIVFVGLIVWTFVARALYLSKFREADRMRERTRIARDLHDQLGPGLTHLAMLGDFVQQQPGLSTTTQMLATRVCESAHELSRSIGEVIWATDPAKDTLRSFTSYVSSYAERFFSGSALQLRLDFPVEVPPLILRAELRHNLFLVVMEALNNVVKHSGATEVRIKLEVVDREMRLSLEDNGSGFSISELSKDGRGLGNMEKRLRDLGGELQIDSAVGRGTRIRARAPLLAK